MIRILPLRTRVTLLYTLMGLILSVLFALAVVFIAEDYEHVLVEEILTSQVQDYAVRLAKAPATELPRTARLNAYLRRPDGTGLVPAALARLPLGIHESEAASEGGIHTAVFDTPSGRLFFTIDLSHIEELEKHLVAVLEAVVVLGTIISAGFGWFLSGAVIGPVRRLADAVQNLPVQLVHTTLGRDMPRDELGRLGTAIDDYQARLIAVEDVERAFFADASHELRTPISVVRGATELLFEDTRARPEMRPLVLRLDRGVRELSELLDALLRLARGRPSPAAPLVMREWLSECLAQSAPVRDGTVRLSVDGTGEVHDLSVAESELVVLGIVRRLLPPGAAGSLLVAKAPDSVEFHFVQHGQFQSPTDRPRTNSSDGRLGLTLIGRLAERLGWQIDDRESEAGLVVLRLTGTAVKARSGLDSTPRSLT